MSKTSNHSYQNQSNPNLLEPLNDATASTIVGGELTQSTEAAIEAILAELEESDSVSAIATSGYVKVKKLNSGG